MKDLFNLIKKHWKVLTVFVLISGLILYNVNLYRKAQEAEKREQIAQHNLNAAQDSIRTITYRNNTYFEKLAYITDDVSSLKKLNLELANEVKNIKGSVNTIIKGDVKIVEKEVPFLVKSEIRDSTLTSFFNYDTTYSVGNYKKLAGYTQYNLKDGTSVAKKTIDEMGISFTTGIKDVDKGKPAIFLKSNYPGFTVTDLQGAELDPKLFQPKKKTPLITPGITIGYTPVTWSNSDQKLKLQPDNFGITAGLSFNVLKLLGFKK